MSDLFEKNVGDLIRAGALPLDPERTARARGRFLREDRPGWKLAAAAAAVLIAVTIVWSARSNGPEAPPVVGKSPQNASPLSVPLEGGNDLLKGSMVLQGKLRFEGRSTLPEGLVFRVLRVHREMGRVGYRLELQDRNGSTTTTATLQNGIVACDWPHQNAHFGRLVISAPDALQDISMVKLLKVPESQRKWVFQYRTPDHRLLAKAGPQLTEITDLAREARELTDRIETACAKEESFKEAKEGLMKEAQRIQARAENFSETGLYPAASRHVAWTVRDLVQGLTVFTWEKGKFAGTRSYYYEDKKGRDHREAVFEFATLKTYLDEAVTIAGREFGLWIVEDFRRSGPRPELSETVKLHRAHTAVAPFAERLSSLDKVDLVKLEDELRALK